MGTCCVRAICGEDAANDYRQSVWTPRRTSTGGSRRGSDESGAVNDARHRRRRGGSRGASKASSTGSAEESKQTSGRGAATRGEGPAAGTVAPTTTRQRIDINSCRLAALRSLPGIGEKKAQKIVAGRPFRSVDELSRVSGVSVRLVTSIRDRLCVDVAGSGRGADAAGGAGAEHGVAGSGGFTPNPAASLPTDSKSGTRTVLEVRARLREEGRRKILVATWNVRNLSTKRSASSLARIRQVLETFDVVALQEVRDDRVVDIILTGMVGWRGVTSSKVGRGARNAHKARVHEERYAFVWRTAVVEMIGEPVVVADAADVWSREPYAAYFKATPQRKGQPTFDFVLCSVHVVFGSNSEKEARQAEIVELGKLVRSVQGRLHGEDDIILCGDFNLPPDDYAWEAMALEWQPVIRRPLTTTIFNSLCESAATRYAAKPPLTPSASSRLRRQHLVASQGDGAVRILRGGRSVLC